MVRKCQRSYGNTMNIFRKCHAVIQDIILSKNTKYMGWLNQVKIFNDAA